MLIDWFTVAAQVVNFLILVWLLKHFLYKPVLAAIDEREKRIAAQLQDAENKKAEAAKEQADFQKKNEDFDRQRSALLAEATSSAKAERDKLLEGVRKDAEELRIKLQKGIEGEAENLKKQIVVLAQREVFSIARKTLADLANVTLEERIISVFLQRLGSMTGRQKEQLKGSATDSTGPAVIRSICELTPEQRAAIRDAVKPLLHEGTEIDFETKSDLIGGIELVANGQKMAWSIGDYLTSLFHAVSGLLEPKSITVPHGA